MTNYQHVLGKGRVLWGVGLDKVLDGMGVGPDFRSSTPLRYTYRAAGGTQICFVANPEDQEVSTTAAFRVRGLAPELWYPDTGRIKRAAMYHEVGGTVQVPLELGPRGSLFVVFRRPAETNRVVSLARNGHTLLDARELLPLVQLTEKRAFPVIRPGAVPLELSRAADGSLQVKARESGDYALTTADGHTQTFIVQRIPDPIGITGPWAVHFMPGWGAPETATFDKLTDWTRRPEEGIKYYSGKAVYSKTFNLPASALANPGCALILDLGKVHDLATVRLNGRTLRTLWLAPWRLDVTAAVHPAQNVREIEVVNAWHNRLVGDQKLPPAQRRTFLTLDTIPKNAPLFPACLLGPVTLQTARLLTIASGD